MKLKYKIEAAKIRRKLLLPGSNWMMICDVDGVLTDGTFSYSENGKFTKTFGPHDSDALNLVKSRIEIVFITADKRGFGISQSRVQDMGFELKLVTSSDRKDLISTIQKDRRVIFIGDSFTDEDALRGADLSFAPANAHSLAKKAASQILIANGGHGAVSEVCLFLNEILKNGSQR
jgi:3-deoxy-D-manno-octulosonate 8-phosphate phosphatase (KDO 8-P phosphatase)